LKPFLTLLRKKGKNHKDVLDYEEQHFNLHDSLFLLLWKDFSEKKIFNEICDFLSDRIQKKKLQFCFNQNYIVSLLAKSVQISKKKEVITNLAMQYFKNYSLNSNSFVSQIPDFLVLLDSPSEHSEFFKKFIYEQTTNYLQYHNLDSETLFSFLVHYIPKDVWKDAIIENDKMNPNLFQFICSGIEDFNNSQISKIGKKLENMKEKVNILNEEFLGFFINHCIVFKIDINDFLIK
jgi:hypothetical protein